MCYFRENGPVGYELPLFGESPRHEAETLMECGLWWAWKSGTRDWTRLDRISVHALLADLPAGLLLLGFDEDVPDRLTDGVAKARLRQFCRAVPVPLATAIAVTPGRRVLFVQEHASATVTALLRALRLDRHGALRTAYAALGPLSLESIADRL